ncbi:MAG: amidohydrolase [Candidatus Omnitrophica bacterium]|nr:amidohydrolase [Candidatus Omnitrophota bacterium]
MLFDAHIHFIPQEISIHSDFYKGIWSDKNKLYEFVDINNIDKAMLVFPSIDAYLKLDFKRLCEIYNFNLENLMKENKKIIGFGIVDLGEDVDLQVKTLKERGFKGISIPSSQDGKYILEELIPLFKVVEKYDLTIFVHPQTINPIGFERVKDPLLMPVLEYSFDISMFLGLLLMEGILEKFNIRFIFSSLAGVIPFLKDRFDRVYTMLRSRNMVKDLGRLPSQILNKIYVDTSAAPINNIRLAIELFGEDKILWGSDYPANADVKKNLKMLDVLGPQLKEKITYKNFAKIFNL